MTPAAAVMDCGYSAQSRRSTTSDQAIKEQEQHCANYRRDKAGWLTWLVPSNYSPQKSRHKRARNTEQNGDQATTRVPAWHKKFRNRADN